MAGVTVALVAIPHILFAAAPAAGYLAMPAMAGLLLVMAWNTAMDSRAAQ